jgi:CBS domain-containing protein
VIGTPAMLGADTPVDSVPGELKNSGRGAQLVADGARFIGILTAKACREAPPGATAGQLVERNYPYVHADHPLSLALEKMGDHQLDLLPVVSRADVSKLLGVVTLPAILNEYGVGVAPAESRERV